MDEFDSLDIVFIRRRENVDTSGPNGETVLDAHWLNRRTGIGLDTRESFGRHAQGKAGRCADRTPPLNINRAAIARDRRSGMTLTAVSKKWGISRSLVCKLVNRAKAGDRGSILPPPHIVDAAGVAEPSSPEARW